MSEPGSAAADGGCSYVRALIDRATRFAPGPGGWHETTPSIAAKPAVVALEDDSGRTILLGTTADARRFVSNRCAKESEGKRADLGSVCAAAVVAPVASGFEADLVYHAMARERTPDAYTKMMARHAVWVVRVDPTATFPEPTPMTLENAAGQPPERFIGPVSEQWAPRLAEALVDAFDLCRYPSILKQSPHGVACAYKEMGRCPAPCDGSETMESYRARVGHAVESVSLPAQQRGVQLTTMMKQAAVEARFEDAAALKKVLERIEALDVQGLRGVTTMDRFKHVVVAPAGRARTARVYAWAGGRLLTTIEVSSKSPPDLETVRLQLGEERVTLAAAPDELEGASVLSRWLAKPSAKGRVRIVRLETPDDAAAIESAIRTATRAGDKDEGVEETEHTSGGESPRFSRDQ